MQLFNLFFMAPNRIICAFILLFSLGSCSMYKKQHFSGYTLQKSHKKNTVKSSQSLKNSKDLLVDVDNERHNNRYSLGGSQNDNLALSNNANAEQNLPSPNLASNSLPLIKSKKELKKEEGCDEIILRSGKSIQAKIVEIGLTEIKYRNCNNLNGPLISVAKEEAFMVKYSNGTSQVFEQQESRRNFTSTTGIRAEPMAIISLMLSVLGLLVGLLLSGLLGLIFCFLGIVFGIASLIRIANSPGKFSGKGLAIGGIITGVLFFISLIVLFIWLLSFF